MKSIIFKSKKIFFSSNLYKEYLFLAFITFVLAAFAFSIKDNHSLLGNDLIWQTLLGISAGLFVGYIVDAVNSWHKIHNIATLLSPIRVEEKLNVYCAVLPNNSQYNLTGPGETVAIGLLFSAYSNIFSTFSKTVSTSNINIILPSQNIKNKHEEQQIIIGGPVYNICAKEFLDQDIVPIHYEKNGVSYNSKLITKSKGKKSWEFSNNIDFGLIIKINRTIHISGCKTWGVIGASTYLFTESSALNLVERCEKLGIDPVNENYYAVISATVPDQNNHYQIGLIQIEYLEKI